MLLTLVSFLVTLGVLVVVHELGHFLVARRFGVRVEEFGVGFPPRLVGWYRDPITRRGQLVGATTKTAPATIYSLNWIPLGGFVRIKGEQGEQATDPDSFGRQRIGRRIAILAAGVSANVLATFLLLSVGFAIGLPQALGPALPSGARVSDVKIQIVDVKLGLPAAEHAVQLGDILVALDGQPMASLEAVRDYLDGKVGTPVAVAVWRDGQRLTTVMTPRVLPETGRGGIGVQLVSSGLVRYPLPLAVWQGARTTGLWTQEIIQAFAGVLARLVQRQPLDIELSGPVGIAVFSGAVAKMGFRYLLEFTALLSLNLAVINFLPFPALDGGRVLFLALERFRGRAINPRLEAGVHNLGFALLIVLVLFITYRDILKLITP